MSCSPCNLESPSSLAQRRAASRKWPERSVRRHPPSCRGLARRREKTPEQCVAGSWKSARFHTSMPFLPAICPDRRHRRHLISQLTFRPPSSAIRRTGLGFGNSRPRLTYATPSCIWRGERQSKKAGSRCRCARSRPVSTNSARNMTCHSGFSRFVVDGRASAEPTASLREPGIQSRCKRWLSLCPLPPTADARHTPQHLSLSPARRHGRTSRNEETIHTPARLASGPALLPVVH